VSPVETTELRRGDASGDESEAALRNQITPVLIRFPILRIFALQHKAAIHLASILLM
jgi:hypothetical protein